MFIDNFSSKMCAELSAAYRDSAPLTSLPDVTIQNIFSRLNPKDFCSLVVVSKGMIATVYQKQWLKRRVICLANLKDCIYFKLNKVDCSDIMAEIHIKLFDDAYKKALALENTENRFCLLKVIATQKAMRGEISDPAYFQPILEWVNSLTERKIEYLVTIANIQVMAGFLDNALETIAAIPAINRSTILSNVAAKQLMAGNLDQAFRLADQIEDIKTKYKMLFCIAAYQEKAGQTEQALLTFNQAVRVLFTLDDNLREIKRIDLSNACANFKRFEQAIRIADRIEHPQNKNNALIFIAVRLSKIGDDDYAEIVFRRAIEAAANRGIFLLCIAVKQAQVGHFEQGIETVNTIQEPELKIAALKEIMKVEACAGFFDLAFKALAMIPNDVSKSKEIKILAKSLLNKGFPAEAFAILKPAFDETDKGPAIMATFAKIQAKLGLWDDALATACKMQDVLHKVKALYFIDSMITSSSH
jgi:tetratricopeptide (TPR) repeat protein